jgi:hypothetical protein
MAASVYPEPVFSAVDEAFEGIGLQWHWLSVLLGLLGGLLWAASSGWSLTDGAILGAFGGLCFIPLLRFAVKAISVALCAGLLIGILYVGIRYLGA